MREKEIFERVEDFDSLLKAIGLGEVRIFWSYK